MLIKVKDDDVGIPKKYPAILFYKFTNARRQGLGGKPSAGLMSIIRTIMAWRKGPIWFESEKRKGTAFYIYLPKE